MSPLVYIVLPVYNWEKYLLQQLMSIYFQDYENWYLVIVNDWSTDSTKSIIDKFISDYELQNKVTLINQENNWVNKSVERWLVAVNKLVKESWNNNSYVTFCDADDLLMINKLSYQINYMENHKDCDLSYHDLILIDENNLVINLSFLKKLNKSLLTNIKCDKFYEFGLSNHIASNTPMFKTDKIDLLLPIPKIFPYHDWWTALVFSWNNYNIVNLGIALWYYRKYTSWMSESWKKYELYKKYENFVVALEVIMKKIKNKERIKQIDEYVCYYKNRAKWERNNISKLRQIIKVIFSHPKIIIYKLMSYIKN